MRKRRRKPVPQFELGYKDEAFKLAGEMIAVPEPWPLPTPKTEDTNQLEMFTNQIDRQVSSESQ